MKLPRRNFLHLAAGAAALPAFSRVAWAQARKVPPKYRGPSGETWAGRGAKPKWLVAAIKGGRKLDDFLIDKSAARKKRKKRRSKR